MALVEKNDIKQIFADQAPSIDKPASFANYPRGWDVARPNNGKPTIKQFNYLQQRTDQNILWMHQNGAALPYDATMEYAEGAVVVKDGELQQLKDGDWVGISGGNNVVESIADLLNIQNPTNYQTMTVISRNAGTGKGGGIFVFHTGSKANDGGMFFATASGSWHRMSLEAWHNVQWWGAVADGEADDTASIRLAVEAHGDVAVWNGASNPTNNSFCTLYFAPSEGSYIVSDTIYILPFMRFKGDSTKGGSLEWNSKRYRSCIEARFPHAINYKFVISTLNRMRATGELCSWDIMPSGINYDSGMVTGCFGSCVEDMVIETLDKNKRVYGAIKMQNSPECSVERCFISGFDVGVATCGAWSSRFDFSSDTYKCGFVAYGDMNNTTIRGYHHGKKGNAVLPLPKQVATLMSYDPTSGLPFNESTKRYGVYLHYAYGFVLDALICEYHDVGILVTQSTGSVNSMYFEGNDISIAAIASSFRIGSLAGVRNNSAFALGTGANIYLDAMVGDHYTTNFILSASDYNSRITIPKLLNVPYHRAVVTDRDVVYLNATGGNDKNSGLWNTQAVKTLKHALDVLLSPDDSSYNVNDRKSVNSKKTLIICDDSTYELSTWKWVTNTDLIIVRFKDSLKPSIRVVNYNFLVVDSNINIVGVDLKRTFDSSWQESQGLFLCYGDCELTIKSSRVDLAYPLVSVNSSEAASVKLKILGGTGEMTGTGKYFSTTSKNVSVSAFIRLNNTGIDLNNSTDNGIAAPVEAQVIKSVSNVL